MGGRLYVVDTNLVRGYLCDEDYWHNISEQFFNEHEDIGIPFNAWDETLCKISQQVLKASTGVVGDLKRKIEEKKGLRREDVMSLLESYKSEPYKKLILKDIYDQLKDYAVFDFLKQMADVVVQFEKAIINYTEKELARFPKLKIDNNDPHFMRLRKILDEHGAHIIQQFGGSDRDENIIRECIMGEPRYNLTCEERVFSTTDRGHEKRVLKLFDILNETDRFPYKYLAIFIEYTSHSSTPPSPP